MLCLCLHGPPVLPLALQLWCQLRLLLGAPPMARAADRLRRRRRRPASSPQVAGLPVYGVAIPTVSGLRLVLERLGAGRGRRKVLWHNQREEPVM